MVDNSAQPRQQQPSAATQAQNEKQILQNVHPDDADEDFQYECKQLSKADGGLEQLLNMKLIGSQTASVKR